MKTQQNKGPDGPPKTRDHWLMKSLPRMHKDIISFAHEKRKIHGDIFTVDNWLVDLVMITDPEAVRYVLQTNNKNYIKSEAYEVMRRFLGEGLLTSEGAYWLKQRRLIQPFFHRQKLAGITRTMAEVANEYKNRWAQLVEKDNRIDVCAEMNGIAMEIAARTLFSTDVSKYIQQFSDAVTVLSEFTIRTIQNPLLSRFPWAFPKTMKAYKRASQSLDTVVYELIAERRASGERTDDLISMLLEAKYEDTGEGMTDKQLRDELIILFLAGHETSANALSWTWYLLSQNPEAKIKLQAELQQVLNGRSPAFEDLPKLEYTRMVIEESMRLYPPAWIIGRKPVEDDVINGYKVKARTNVLMIAYEIHRHESLWDEPDAFIPERFSVENKKTHPKFAYFPFGGGPRLCIGNNFAMMEMQLVIATLAQHFDLELNQQHEIQLEPLITLRPKGGIQMKLKERVAETV